LCHLNHDPSHILCLTEHHLHHDELASLHIDTYTFIHSFIHSFISLGAYYCWKSKHNSGVCMFVHNSIKFTSLNIDNYCLDQDFKVWAIHLNCVYDKLCILAVYSSPLCNFNTFLTNFDLILHNFF